MAAGLAHRAKLQPCEATLWRRILIASIMEEYNKDAWETLIERCEEVGVDAFEVNFSCPHGMPERKMGMAMGQDCEVLKVGALDQSLERARRGWCA